VNAQIDIGKDVTDKETVTISKPDAIAMEAATVTITFRMERANLSGEVVTPAYDTPITLSQYGKLANDAITVSATESENSWHTLYTYNGTSKHWDDATVFGSYDKYAVYKVIADIPVTTADVRAGYTSALSTTITFAARSDDGNVSALCGFWTNASATAVPNFSATSLGFQLALADLTDSAHTKDVGYVMMNAKGENHDPDTHGNSFSIGLSMTATDFA